MVPAPEQRQRRVACRPAQRPTKWHGIWHLDLRSGEVEAEGPGDRRQSPPGRTSLGGRLRSRRLLDRLMGGAGIVGDGGGGGGIQPRGLTVLQRAIGPVAV